MQYLTDIYNISVKTSIIPNIWKKSHIVPLPKPGKDSSVGKNWRPISLLCCPAKVLERLLLPHIDQAIRLQPTQHGFRKRHSTCTGILSLITDVADGFCQRKPAARTVLVALDLTAAFDTVNHNTLSRQISELEAAPQRVRRWIINYLHGRQAVVTFRGETSIHRCVRQGVVQGGVLSPSLFNLYMSDLPTPPSNVKLMSYADDVSVYTSGPVIEDLTVQLTEYLSEVADFFDRKNLLISASKSSVTLFTPQTAQANIHPQVQIRGDVLPLNRTPKILGVILDTMFCFGPHCKAAASRVQQRNAVMKALAGTDWGCDKETLMMTYRAISRSIISYCCPAWTPIIKETHWNRLQTAQNSALRIATGCHLMTSIDDLHREAHELPVRHHAELLSRQFALSCHSATHPCHNLAMRPRPPRARMKPNIFTKHHEEYKDLLDHGSTMDEDNHKSAIKVLHTRAVSDALNSYRCNKVLGQIPPAVSESEIQLPRTTRTHLAQLRTGYSKHLTSYMSRINPEVRDECPRCQEPGHTTSHLFSCQENPTDLTVESLWLEPAEAATFLGLATEEDVER